MGEYLDKFKEDLRKLQSKKKVAVIKVQGYLKILSQLLDIDSPELVDEVAETWRRLKELVGNIYREGTLLGILQREKELWKMTRPEEG